MSIDHPLGARDPASAPAPERAPAPAEPTPPERAPDPAPLASTPAPIEEPAASHRLLLLMLGLIVGWGLLMQRFGSTANIYAVMGPFALSVVLVVVALASSKLVVWLRPNARAILSGVGVGVAMTLVTYPAYALLRSLIPPIEPYVASLYASAHQTTLGEALPWTLAIIIAEELLWRGALLYVLARRVPPALAILISVATYAVAQFGTGSWIVMLLALVCGTLWTLQRHLTRSLLSPLISHLIWTPVVILFFPVTGV
ncbi:MAG TPA: CPBP family intramembrane glutamic endopeptidase [Polyangiaceae bacterium]|nr:CPBP family intramembrane glutamic endopeptidase [Polyangiaceae bacterium]